MKRLPDSSQSEYLKMPPDEQFQQGEGKTTSLACFLCVFFFSFPLYKISMSKKERSYSHKEWILKPFSSLICPFNLYFRVSNFIRFSYVDPFFCNGFCNVIKGRYLYHVAPPFKYFIFNQPTINFNNSTYANLSMLPCLISKA